MACIPRPEAGQGLPYEIALGWHLSSTAASGQPVEFGFPANFTTFSPERLFSPVGSTITDVSFFLPGTMQRGVTHGFGVVFTDVELNGSSSIELFDLAGNSLVARNVLTASSGGLSFLGFVATAGEKIFSARVDSGIDPLLANGNFASGQDNVVMDDFIFGEAVVVPEPASLALVGFGLLGAVGLAWRRSRN